MNHSTFDQMYKKIYFLLIIVFCCATISYGQKCKYDYEKKDAFSGNYTKGKSAVLAGGGLLAWRISFNLDGSSYFVKMHLSFLGRKEEILEKGDTVLFAFESGEFLTLTAKARVFPVAQSMGGIFTVYDSDYDVDAKTLQQLSTKKIKAVKAQFGSAFEPLDIPEKNRGKIVKAAECILH